MSNTSDSPSQHDRPTRIAVVVSGWPRLSESFALNELMALHDAGMLVAVFATKRGDIGERHPAAVLLDSSVHFLEEGTIDQQADEIARVLTGQHVDGMHGYFAHQPAAVARAAAARLGIPFGFSAHAKDPGKVEPAELAERARAASCIVACNAQVAEQLRAVGADPILVPHGVDLASFSPVDCTRGDRIELLAVGRLVAKKGFDVLIDAMGLLDFDWRLRIVGDGPLLLQLHDQARHTADAHRINFVGARTHAELPALYHEADIVVVPSVIDTAGDQDGLPNVVLEAMACGLAIVGSDVAAIPTAIEHRATGLLVDPGDRHGLANAISELAKDADLRAALGANARVRAESQFGLAYCTSRFLTILADAYG
jgi:glycosyltransferase involved in cell wall biosynthesis